LSWEEFFGLAAGILIAASYIPQIWKLFQLKSAKEISLLYTLFQLCGGLMWLSYGFIKGLPAVYITNIVNVILIFLIFFAKLRYGRQATAEKAGRKN
jgi:MtN3 and saliva related transmembrane protein